MNGTEVIQIGLFKFREKVIGVIGITGNPNDVRQFTQLVTVTAELLINKEYTLNKHVLNLGIDISNIIMEA
ncbi:sugar diacid recognition domain-containing protein [Clostridium sp.]|uniref:sugar diacid recognition domain-containing protein n=1 Tax=Clostridium sp. TaxID=1506 RepID=UPI00263558EE|nr:sugar diacid recognition domain-containing protein [Clostridium sp.]